MKKTKWLAPRVLKIGLIGCGAIGTGLALEIQKRFPKTARLAYVCDVDVSRAEMLLRRLKIKPSLVSGADLIKKSDFIVEAASAHVSLQVAEHALRHHKQVMIMSVGGLVGSDQIFRWIKKSRGTLIVPSGAICGLDGLKAASLGKIRSVTLRTSKPPRALGVTAVKKPRPIFKGNALQAIRRYPQNINVSCILSLAGIGAKKTRVEIICNPHLKRNVHEVEIVGDFGRLVTRSENVPSKANPKTSQLAILSAVATLKQYLDHFQIGT